MCKGLKKRKEATVMVNNNIFYFGAFHILLVTFKHESPLKSTYCKVTTNVGCSLFSVIFSHEKKFRKYNLIKSSGQNNSVC